MGSVVRCSGSCWVNVILSVWILVHGAGFSSSLIGAVEKPVADLATGVLVWRPYDGKIRWSGGRDVAGFASGEGTLSVYGKAGQVVASFTGMMRSGRLVGNVRAVYHTSSDRASYEGGFINWSEHGIGTMTYRNGKQVAGVWRDGQLLRETLPNEPASVATSAEMNHGVDALDDAFGEEGDLEYLNDQLQASYDRLKNGITGKARDDLVIFQRAWLRYEQQIDKLAASLWSSRSDFALRREQIRGVVTRQRNREIEFVLTAIRGDDLPLAPVDSSSTLNERIKSQVNLLASKTSTEDVQTLVDAWIEAKKLAQIIGVARWSRESVVAAIQAQQHTAISHLLTALKLLVETPILRSSPAMTSKGTPGVAGLEQVVKEACALFTLVSKHWEIGDKPLVALPFPLTDGLTQQMSRVAAEAQTLVSTAMSEGDTYAIKRVFAMTQMNEALREWSRDATAALSLFDKANTALDDNDKVTREWWNRVLLKARSDHEGAMGLLAEIPAKLQIGDVPAVIQRVNELLNLQPSRDSDKLIALLKGYERLVSDKSLRAMDSDWLAPTLPNREMLQDAAKAVEDFDGMPESALTKALRPCRDAMAASNLLLTFMNDFEPSGKLDSPHPISALQKMRDRESWEKLMQSHPPEAKVIVERLKSLDKLIRTKLEEYEALLKDAQTAEDERKFLRAGELYRKAWLLDKQESLLEKARKCESKASGL